jgi:hypothetical protein
MPGAPRRHGHCWREWCSASVRPGPVKPGPQARRVQQLVDRRFNRAHYDADQTIAAFAARLKDAVELDSVRDDLASVVRTVLEPAQVSVWISQQGNRATGHMGSTALPSFSAAAETGD